MLATEGEELIGQIRCAQGCRRNFPHRFRQLCGEVRRVPHHVGVTMDDREEIIEVMRNPARELSDGIHLLRLQYLRFKTQPRRHIPPAERDSVVRFRGAEIVGGHREIVRQLLAKKDGFAAKWMAAFHHPHKLAE